MNETNVLADAGAWVFVFENGRNLKFRKQVVNFLDTLCNEFT